MADWLESNAVVSRGTSPADTVRGLKPFQAQAPTDDWLAQNALPVGVRAPGEVFGPQATTRRALRAIPYLTGAVGGALTAPIGAGIPGATIGGMVGKAAELAIAGERPPSAVEGLRTIGGEGIEQGLLQAPSALVGPAARGLMGLRDLARTRAVGQAVKELRAISSAREAANPLAKRIELAIERSRAGAQARDIGPRVEAALQKARGQRMAAGKVVSQTIEQGQGNITIGDLTDHIVAKQQATFRGAKYSPPDRTRLARDIRERIREVAQEKSLGALKGNKLVFDLEESQHLKRAFQTTKRGAFNALSRGVRPNPDLDIALADAWKELIEQRAPGVQQANQAARTAIRREQRLTATKAGLPTEEEKALKQAQREVSMRAREPALRAAGRARQRESEAALAARVLAQRSAIPFRTYSGIPVRGGVATPGLSLRPGTILEALGKLGEGVGSRAGRETAFYGPRIAALLKRLQEEEALRE